MRDKKPPGDGDDKPDLKSVEKIDAGADAGEEESRRFDAHEEDFNGDNDEALAIKLSILQQEHADLDSAIRALDSQPHHDRLSVARLKKKKLKLKDIMQAIKDQLTPDIIA